MIGQMVQVTPGLVNQAVDRGILTREQADQLWKFFAEATPQEAGGPGFSFTNVLYYFGGVLAIGAMTLFMTLGWQAFGGWGMFAIALIYSVIALSGARYLLAKGYSTPAGILSALAVALVPLAIYGLQNGLGLWTSDRAYREYNVFIDWRWMEMELATLAAGALVLYWFRRPFTVMPIAVTLWYMSMDLAPFLAGGNDPDWHFRKLVSILFGLAMLALAVYVDMRTKRRPDYAFWLYVFGTFAAWGALSAMNSSNELGKLVYAGINVAMIFAGAIIARRVFTVCGGLGLFGYLGYLSYNVFKDSIVFPFALTILGLAIVGAGVLWQKHEANIRDHFRTYLPVALREAGARPGTGTDASVIGA